MLASKLSTVYHVDSQVWQMKSLSNIKNMRVGRNISVGIATGYRLDGPGIESRWGARFSAPVQTGSGAHPSSYTMCIGYLLQIKRPAVALTTHPI